jgi:hypothetical protein
MSRLPTGKNKTTTNNVNVNDTPLYVPTRSVRHQRAPATSHKSQSQPQPRSATAQSQITLQPQRSVSQPRVSGHCPSAEQESESGSESEESQPKSQPQSETETVQLLWNQSTDLVLFWFSSPDAIRMPRFLGWVRALGFWFSRRSGRDRRGRGTRTRTSPRQDM